MYIHSVSWRLTGGALRRDQARDQGGADLAAMNVRPVQPRRVVPGLLEVGGLEGDQGAEFGGVRDREVEHDAPADRAAHDHRPVELQGTAEGTDGSRVGRRRQPVLARLPAVGRRRLAVPRHVEGQHPEALRDLGVGQQMAVLPVVGAGGVQADQRDPLAGLLEVEAVRDAVDLHPQVAADHRLERGRHGSVLLRQTARRGRGAMPTFDSQMAHTQAIIPNSGFL